MADINLKYPQKLGRFNSDSCMDVYYSEAVGRGRFNIIEAGAATTAGYLLIDITLTEFAGWINEAGLIFSSGIISGKVVSYAANVLTIKVNKDSFVTETAYNAFLLKHNDIYYDFETLRHYNGDAGNIENSLITDIKIHTKKRINSYSRYSNFGFSYNKDFHYEIETKTIVIRDMSQLDDIIRASSYVLKAQDESVIRTSALDDLPDVIGISGDTVDIIAQPYFGGVQNNEWYRATLIDNEFVWSNGRYKGKFKFKVTG